ncbi:uncharacterized protein LOC124645677 [Helicoverpa zea]|uniref:uncharacterized protein LOC124645677 n=1 Tax=Helicoverpa zea TaxID=7113 RepID=UPI001F5A712B|nr:uncharacterized protein LOC124645677 [Helicoverpa zea]
MPRHRWWVAVTCGVLAACALLPLAAGEGDEADSVVTVMAVTLDGSGEAARALAALAVAALAARGVRGVAVPAPDACGPAGAGPAAQACRYAVLRSLVVAGTRVALLPAPAAHPPHPLKLRDAGLMDLGDAVPPSRLACHASPAASPAASGSPRSLLDFTDESVARSYYLSSEDLDSELRVTDDADWSSCSASNCSSALLEPEWCSQGRACATLLTDAASSARELAGAARAARLRVRVRRVGARLAALAARLRRPLLLCSRDLPRKALPSRYAALAPPPCDTFQDICAFDPFRLLKIVNERELHLPSAISVLGRLQLNETELQDFIEQYRTAPEAAAAAVLARHSHWVGPPREARTAVMIPTGTHRESFDASALRAAAQLAEEDSNATETVSFKVELLYDRCASTLAFKYLTDALGAEFGALSAIAGPACGAAFADVARQSPTLSMPVLGYTPQAPPPAPAAPFALLAAGDARQHTAAWAAVAAHMGWRRLAVLSELATRAALDVADLAADVILHVELPADSDDVDLDKISQWAARAAAARARVLFVCVEDARVVRAALCAGRAAGLLPRAGAVWLLPGALPPAWLRPGDADAHNCSAAQLREAAAAHLRLAPAWQADWDAALAAGAVHARRFAERLSVHSARAGAGPLARPPAHAALLYDALAMWHAALARRLAAQPAALDDLHHRGIARALIEDVTKNEFSGLTGKFEWSGAARVDDLVLLQSDGDAAQRVGRWRRGSGLALGPAALRWLTPDGSAPDDGTERCALQALADALGADCRTAFVALGALLLCLLVAALAAAAWHCKRRAERKYRRRLAALGLTRLDPKPGGLDRWEIPRERVVINRKLGTGAFGTVYGGHALLAEDRGWSAVAVKTLKAGASTEEKLDFLSEAEAMKRFDHKNVVRLLGVVTKTEPVCTVMEFMLYGDLKNYLLARRHLAAGGGAEVSAARLTAMALDAARALSYLAQLRYVHRDVAARNCLVSAHRVVKLADFGMTRLVFENDYYRFSRKGMLPVRWMAPESLALGVFSPASDVWSFGVLLYEIVTFGSLPFQGLSNAEVLARVKAGHTLELPAGLKPQLEGLIKSCWQQEHKARPSAAEVAAFLADSPRLLAPCLDVPLDALPLDLDCGLDPWRESRDRAEARWVSWAAPASAATDTTYLSADAPPPQDTDAFLP